MIPANAFTPTPIVSSYLPPNDQPYQPLTQVVLGGIAIGDISQGRNLHNWTVTYVSPNILIKDFNNATAFTLAAADVTSVGLAFDASMRIVITWTTLTGVKLYYYDTTSSTYITRDFPDFTSSRVTADNTQSYYAAFTDIIFAYTRNNNLYYRQQRDNYDIEYVIGPTPVTNILVKAGPNVENRLQFELVDSLEGVAHDRLAPVPINLFSEGATVLQPYYSIVPNVSVVSEGDSVTYTITTTNVPDGTVLSYSNITTLTPTYTITPSVRNAIEGGSITYTITTTNVPDGTVLHYSDFDIPLYSITPDVTSVVEGGDIVYTVNATNTPDGTVLYWKQV